MTHKHLMILGAVIVAVLLWKHFQKKQSTRMASSATMAGIAAQETAGGFAL